MSNKNLVITIGRECGSGGHEIGEKLGEHYGIKFYDRDILDLLAEKMNVDTDTLAKLEEKVTGHVFRVRKSGFALQQSSGALMGKLSKSDELYLRERALIRELAEQESFVIVGRGANDALADYDNAVHLFVSASEEFKIPRVKKFYGLDTDKEAKKKMEQVDKARRDYVHYYTGLTWGTSEGHDFMIDSSSFGIDATVDIITKIVEKKLG